MHNPSSAALPPCCSGASSHSGARACTGPGPVWPESTTTRTPCPRPRPSARAVDGDGGACASYLRGHVDGRLCFYDLSRPTRPARRQEKQAAIVQLHTSARDTHDRARGRVGPHTGGSHGRAGASATDGNRRDHEPAWAAAPPSKGGVSARILYVRTRNGACPLPAVKPAHCQASSHAKPDRCFVLGNQDQHALKRWSPPRQAQPR